MGPRLDLFLQLEMNRAACLPLITIFKDEECALIKKMFQNMSARKAVNQSTRIPLITM
jgi:hypothetical protein